MNFDWAITEQKSTVRPWIGENFNGYFTDIRRAARKSLPRKPNRDLKGLLGLTLSPRSLEGSFLSVQQPSQRNQGVIQTLNRQPDFRPIENENSWFAGVKSFFLCRNSRTEDCSNREKTVFALSIYFAIVIFILLIIVVTLSLTLSRLSEQDDAKTQARIERVTTVSIETTSTTNTPKPILTTPSPILTSSLTSRSSSSSSVPSSTKKASSATKPTITTRVHTTVSTNKTAITSLPSKTTTLVTPSLTSSSPGSSSTSASRLSTTSSSTVSKLPFLNKQSIECSTAVCQSANETLQKIDFTTSPCEDFYTFSCGEWLSQRSGATSSSHDTPQSTLEEYKDILLREIIDILEGPLKDGDDNFPEKVSKSLYKACQRSNQDTDAAIALQELHHYVDPIGMSQDATFTNPLDDMLRACVINFQVTPFFKMKPTPIVNQDGQLHNGLKIQPPTLSLEHETYQQSAQIGEGSYNYVEALSSILYTYLTSFRHSETPPDSTIGIVPTFDALIEMTKKVFILEANISKILEDIESRNVSLSSTSNVLKYTSMKKSYPNIDWDSATGGVSNDVLIEIVNPSYFENLDNLWVSSDVEDLKLYVFVTLLAKRVWTYMPVSIRVLLANILDNDGPKYSDNDCVAHALDLANEEVHTVYVEQNTQLALNNRQVLSNIKNSVVEQFLEFVSSSTWIQSDVERVVSALARNLNAQFSPLRTNIMPTPSITATNPTFLSMALELYQQKMYNDFSVLGMKVTEIPLDWTDVRPVYNDHLNTIGFPTGISVYISSNIPIFELYGHIGMLISEEILNSLLGVSSAGFPPQWWGTNTMIGFDDDVIDCFIKQASTTPNGIYGLENIIKLKGAFQLMNKIYLTEDTTANVVIEGTEFTQHMMFLTNIAQSHCQVYDETIETAFIAERVNSVFKNSIEFRREFSCPNTAQMVAKDLCAVFP